MKYLINYITGAVQYADDLQLSEFVNGLTTGTILTVIDVENKRALIKNGENVGWAEIPKKKFFTGEELEELK